MPEETEKTLKLAEIIQRRITYIEAEKGMLVDENVWRLAHAQHTRHRHLHALSAHRPGIVYGLEVLPTRDPATVMVAPGVAIDAFGRTVINPDFEWIRIEPGETRFIVIMFDRATPDKAMIDVVAEWPGWAHLKLEGTQTQQTNELPGAPWLELARIAWSGSGRLREAAHPSETELNTIVLLHRPVAFPYCYADIALKEISFHSLRDATSYADSRTNRPGLWNLMHEGNGHGFHLNICSTSSFDDPMRDLPPAMLYMAGSGGFIYENQGTQYGDIDLEEVERCLATGSLLFAEACNGSAEFTADFKRFAREKLNANLRPLPAGSRLMRSHSLFPTAPSGRSQRGEILADLQRGVLFSTYDYGGAWQGNAPENSANPRENTRQALEFGLNIVAYAGMRQRRQELVRQGAIPLED